MSTWYELLLGSYPALAPLVAAEVEPGLEPLHAEVEAEGDRVVLVADAEHVRDLEPCKCNNFQTDSDKKPDLQRCCWVSERIVTKCEWFHIFPWQLCPLLANVDKRKLEKVLEGICAAGRQAGIYIPEPSWALPLDVLRSSHRRSSALFQGCNIFVQLPLLLFRLVKRTMNYETAIFYLPHNFCLDEVSVCVTTRWFVFLLYHPNLL